MRTKSNSSTITARRKSGAGRRLPNPHPGVILAEMLLRPLRISPEALARRIRLSPGPVAEIVGGRERMTAELDLRLARYFGVTAGIWLQLQADYDLAQARRSLGRRIAREVRPRAA